MSEEIQFPKDKMRLCPVCRMPISVWAIRCRFCGETVGRPKREIETFTVEDLGGETPTAKNTLSNEVLEAIEEFRKELVESPQKEEPPTMWNLWGKYKTTTYDSQGKKIQRINPIRWIIIFGTLSLFILLSYFFGPSAWSQLKLLFQGKTENVVEYDNRALIMLENGEPIERVLQEALKAFETTNSEEDRQILLKVRTKLIEQIDSLLTKEPYNPLDTAEASRICSEVIKIDYDSKIQDLYKKVIDEVSAYKMTVTQIDIVNKKATFHLNNPSFSLKEQTVSEGELIQNRFLVKQILSSRVRLEDTKIVNKGIPRKLTISLMGEVKADS
ncbi:MAG: hypothetical protein ACP5QY_07650 [Candidatus Hydrogenedens sp.]